MGRVVRHYRPIDFSMNEFVSLANSGITLFYVLLAVGIVVAVYMLAKFVYEKYGDFLNLFGPSVVVTPQVVQDFMDEPSNQEGAYIPWTPTIEPDEAYPPAWLKKGVL